jgi:hypothetical protein
MTDVMTADEVIGPKMARRRVIGQKGMSRGDQAEG